MKPGQLPSTRPVVSACTGVNVPLSELICEIVEPVMRNSLDSAEVISSEHLLHEVDELNKKWKETDCGNQEPPLLIDADAKALFPSLDHHQSAEVVRKEILRTNYHVEGTNWQEMARYLAMTSSPGEWSRWKVKKMIPSRISNTGVTSGITGKEAQEGVVRQSSGSSLISNLPGES